MKLTRSSRKVTRVTRAKRGVTGFTTEVLERSRNIVSLKRKHIPKTVSAVVAATLVLGTGVMNALADPTSVPPTSLPVTALQSNWNAIVSASPTLANATVSAYAYDVTTNQVLADVNANQRQTPASVTKLVTSAAGLAKLGPNYQYTTQVAIPSGTSDSTSGPIYLVGGGDPWLEANGAQDLEALAAQVAAKVKTATQVVGVNSLFTPPTYETSWLFGDLPYNYSAGISALMSERSEIQVKVVGSTPGQAPTVTLVFNSSAQAPEYFHVINQATTLDAGQPSTLSVTRQLGTNNIVVTGEITPGKSSAPFLSVGNAALFTATLFQDLLKKNGVTFTSDPTTGTLPSGTQTIATHNSGTLENYLTIQNQFSINQMADNLYRMLGATASGTGSPDASSAAMTDFLQQAGVSTSGMQIVDGSGLSSLNEISAKQMVQLLSYASGQSWFQAFKQSLMQVNSANNAGILASHHFNLPPGTNVWVKTGNLSNQWNYAGYTQAENGDLIAFAILDDGAPTYLNSKAGSPLDQMIVDAASWPSEPTPPAPSTSSTDGTASLPPQLSALLPQGVSALVDPGSVLGVSIVNAATGQPSWSVNGDKLLRAGLLPRVAVATTALQNGASFKGVTIESSGTVTNGTLNGSLIINGNGDPTLTRSDLDRLASAVKKAGIRSVSGPIEFLDAKDTQLWNDEVPWDDAGQVWAPPSSMLVVDKDIVTLSVKANGSQMTPTVEISPADAPITVVNDLTVSSGAEDAHVNASLGYGTNTYFLKGTVSPGKSVTLQVAPPNAGLVAAFEFKDALTQAGVTTSADVRAVTQDPGSNVIASLAGPSVADLVPSLLRDGSNEVAMQVYNLLGDNGYQSVTNALGPVDQIADPTGVGLQNYMTPNSVTALLSQAYRNQADASLVRNLSSHLWITQSPQVRTITGYIHGLDGTVYAVAVIQSELPWHGDFAPSTN